MNRYLIILSCIVLTGCASNRPQEPTNSLAEQHQYEPAIASALVFDAPAGAAYPLPGLDRAAREPGAFIGYQEGTTENFSIDMDDNQSNEPGLDYYNRSIVTEKTGTRYR